MAIESFISSSLADELPLIEFQQSDRPFGLFCGGMAIGSASKIWQEESAIIVIRVIQALPLC
jgi:hypothetical protein